MCVTLVYISNQATPEVPMYTTAQLDNGILNNYANEPSVYLAPSPSPEQRINYAQQGAVAALFVVTLLLVSLGVS